MEKVWKQRNAWRANKKRSFVLFFISKEQFERNYILLVEVKMIRRIYCDVLMKLLGLVP